MASLRPTCALAPSAKPTATYVTGQKSSMSDATELTWTADAGEAPEQLLQQLLADLSREDREDALAAGKMYGIEQLEIDLTPAKTALVSALGDALTAEGVPEWAKHSALININPRLRMTAVYAVAQARGYLVAGTGNACEYAMGYFTKWGDGAYDFNPIADLTVEEVYEHLRYLGSPAHIIEKAPSAGLYAGQTDEKEMGVTYAEITAYIKGLPVPADKKAIMDAMSSRSAHKRVPPLRYEG